MPVRLFVGNLPYDTTEAELREYFSAVGTLSFVQVAMDRETGKARGFGFVEFADRAQAEEAIRKFNNQPFKNRPLAINEARPKESSSPGRISSPPAPSFSRRPPTPNTDWIKDTSMAEPPLTKDFDSPSRRNRKQKSRDDRGENAPRGLKRKRKSGKRSWDDDDFYYD
ncbi:RNA recognition motif domain-containing protein [Desulforhabdus amnigena]|jgi:RNA recognition motif-containing protein|uniref:RRM domain-containing protein n=1 Tax=Desulforhabdus amnigena TaxID=40218 RepID=A0A9W6FVA1_9BACT|nr:hypothetical protein [Desulforhabdus amnigena]NLJ28095.1 RNA-binding protein [Deltaproteobacteria bacterium]GLI35514.1 hypothetical protein DAMNIGENAA_29470 [Desulforhabdus amnigena]